MPDLKISTLVIDDEELARSIIKKFAENIGWIDIVGECENGFDAIKKITGLKPQLIFLDIQMPKINGFEMLELLDEKPQIIFSTAYDEFAIKAFEQNAVDYLLKPYSKDRFLEACTRAKEKIEGNVSDNEKITKLQDDTAGEILKRVVAKTKNSIEIIPVSDVCMFEAQDDYVMIYTKTRKYLKQQTMKFYESHLNNKDFVRIHRSYIVNVGEILKIEPFEKDSYIVVMKNQQRIRASRSGYKNLKEILDI